MATGAPNAILAINSLDRYRNVGITQYSSFVANWVFQENYLILGDPTDPTAPFGTPLVGATIDVVGAPANTKITQIVPGIQWGASVFLDKTMTNGGAAATFVGQIYAPPTSEVAPIDTTLQCLYANLPPHSDSFNIQAPAALIYGYIQRLVVSQIQLEYNIPTVVRLRNDELPFFHGGSLYTIVIPYGFYSPEELAAYVENQMNVEVPSIDMQVTYDNITGYTFESQALEDFYFPSDEQIQRVSIRSNNAIRRIFRTYRLFGITLKNAANVTNPTGFTTIYSSTVPNYLYTPYIDIFSDVLTNYQTIKDSNTQINNYKGMVARIYLSGNGNVQPTFPASALGTAPFVVTLDMNSPKIIKWTPDVAVNSIDFQMRDCYGDLIPVENGEFNTEFQMTLLCVEGREWNS
jgi:hypothetical protein